MKTSYKIITPLLSLGTIASLFFFPIIRIFVSSGLSSSETRKNLLASFGFKEYNSIYDMIKIGRSAQFDTLKSLVSTFLDKNSGSIDFSNIKYLYCAIAFLAILVLLLVALAVLSIVMKKVTIPMILTFCAGLSAFLMNTFFKAFAKPFLNGSIGIGSLFSGENAAIGSLLGNLARVDTLELGVAYSIALFILSAMFIFAVCVLFDDDKSKR